MNTLHNTSAPAYRRHSQSFKPVPMKPVRYTTHRRLAWRHLVRWLLLAAVVAGLVLATVWVIGRMHATDAALQRAHAQGMAVGMNTCPGL